MTTREWCLSKRPICFIRGWSTTKRKYADAKSDPNTWKTFRYYCLHHIHPSHPYFIINHSPHSTPYFPFSFTYTFHLFLSIHNPQIKARGSFTCLFPLPFLFSIAIFHFHFPFLVIFIPQISPASMQIIESIVLWV